MRKTKTQPSKPAPKTRSVRVSLSPSAYRQVQRKAELAGLSLPEWTRRVLLFQAYWDAAVQPAAAEATDRLLTGGILDV